MEVVPEQPLAWIGADRGKGDVHASVGDIFEAVATGVHDHLGKQVIGLKSCDLYTRKGGIEALLHRIEFVVKGVRKCAQECTKVRWVLTKQRGTG